MPQLQATPSTTNFEKIAASILLLVGVAARLAFPSHIAIEHFDEGVYASNIYCPQTDYRYPSAEFYAPPLLPALIEWAIIFAGPNIGPFVFPLLFSIGTLLLVWHIGRAWFSPRAGLCALTLAATSDFHMHYSRMALTDGAMCFFLLLAVYLIGESLSRTLQYANAPVEKPKANKKRKKSDTENDSPPNANVLCVGAGLVTALCWWTKYNGWLPIAIMIGGVAGWMAIQALHASDSLRRQVTTIAMPAAIVAFVAILFWLPFLFSLPDGRTYSDIAANHGKYLVGLEEWFSSIVRHANHHRLLNGWMTAIGVAATLVFWELPDLDLKPQIKWNLLAYFLLTMAIGQIGHPLLLITLTSFVYVVQFLAKQWTKRTHDDSPTAIRKWLLVAWWVGLLLTTPLYWPYPRLGLPWLMVSWLIVSVAVSEIWSSHFEIHDDKTDRKPGALRFAESIDKSYGALGTAPILLAGLLFVVVNWSEYDFVTAWEDRSTAKQAAQAIVKETRPDLALVYGEPAILFHLSAANIQTVPIGGLSSASKDLGNNVRSIVVIGPHARSNKAFAKELESANSFGTHRFYKLNRSPVVFANQTGDDATATTAIETYEVK